MRYCLFLMCFFCFGAMGDAQTTPASRDTSRHDVNYLNTPTFIEMAGNKYYFAWSSHPSKSFYIQEYVPKKEKVEHHTRMVVVQALLDSEGLEQLVSRQVNILEDRKKTDKVLNYKLFNNEDKSRYVLDFILSEGKGVIDAIEWNGYRYEYLTNAQGARGIMIVGISLRETKDVEGFLGSLGELRKENLAALAKFSFGKDWRPF